MSKKNIILLLFIGAISLACSSDDNSGTGENNTQLGYFPQYIGGYWVYDVQGENFSGEDYLYVSGETTENGTTYKTFATQTPPAGFYSTLLTTGKLSSSDSKTLYTGTINIGEMLGGMEGLTFDLTNFVILDAEASQGNLLSSESGEIYQDFGDYALDVEYNLSSISKGSLELFVLENGSNYNDVKITSLTLSLKVNFVITFMGIQIPYTILNTQEVISSSQYYANNIGMIFADTQIEYHLEEIPDIGIEIPVPENYQYNLQEILTTFSLESSL